MRRIKLILAAAASIALMMVVALPSALAQDWCYGGCSPLYWGAGYWSTPTETATTDTLDVEECWWVEVDEDEWILVCELD